VGNLYVSNLAGDQSFIAVFAPTANGNTAPVSVLNQEGVNLCTDANNNLYVATFATGILEFAPGASGNAVPIRTISTALYALTGLAVGAAGDVYFGANGVTINNARTAVPTIFEYSASASGSATPVASFIPAAAPGAGVSWMRFTSRRRDFNETTDELCGVARRLGRFHALHAEARRAVLANRHRTRRQSGGRAHSLPVYRQKTTPDRRPAHRADEWMPPPEPHQRAEHPIRHRLAVQVDDEPADARRPFHPFQQAHDLRFRQMVHHAGRGHHIGVGSFRANAHVA